jgi:hypothetical protein
MDFAAQQFGQAFEGTRQVVDISGDGVNNSGRPVAEAVTLPDDMLERMGLADVLGILRSRGLRAILARVKRELAGKAQASS